MPNPDQVNLNRVNPVWLMSYTRWLQKSVAFFKRRFAKGAQRNITDCFKAWITTDSINTFSITFCILFTVYCTCKIAKDTFRVVLYVTTFYMQHCAVARFVFKKMIFLRLYVRSWYVQCCMLLKESVFVPWINKFKCSLKTSVRLVLTTEHLKL